jgi:tRNA(Ile)-lysidine synthase
MQAILPKPGTYVVAVSGGVDSMVLINLLNSMNVDSNQHKLIVAHLDHGIREDSALDRQLVQDVAKSLGLPFVYEELKLGPNTSENRARTSRYQFLEKVQKSAGADAIVTAHHQDDLLETAIINILRGTGRKGLSALSSNEKRIRPLLNYPKIDIIKYAKDNNVAWREDITNEDLSYLRNYVRHKILTKLDSSDRLQLTELINNVASINNELDDLLLSILNQQSDKDEVNRQWFIQLPHRVAREVLATWHRSNNISFNKKTLERLVVASKVGLDNKRFPIAKGQYLVVNRKHLALLSTER